MKRIGNIIYYIVLAALCAVALLVAFSAFPIPGNYELKVVRSGSMEPTIHTGSVVVVKPASSYAVDDIVMFEGGMRDEDGKRVPVTHRIVAMHTEGSRTFYKTKGDANEEADTGEIMERSIFGRVLFSVPYVGFAVEAARRPYGFLAIILVPALIIVWDQGANIYREVRKLKRAKQEHAANV
ncbi:MAG: type signal peptidase signal peptidase endoplasmic reticulum-type [Candidatus Parcubacteria bacterium]|jgi:signal peptidase